jgi:hypothetical protein
MGLKGPGTKMNWLAVNRQSKSEFDFDIELSQFCTGVCEERIWARR